MPLADGNEPSIVPSPASTEASEDRDVAPWVTLMLPPTMSFDPATVSSDLYTVNADGSGLFQVTNTPDIDEFGGDWGTHAVTP